MICFCFSFGFALKFSNVYVPILIVTNTAPLEICISDLLVGNCQGLSAGWQDPC